MFASAADHFHPSNDVAFRRLNGTDGPWPAGTLFRYAAIVQHADELDFDYLFMCDADMKFVAPVGPEILGAEDLTAVQHPGYVGMPREALPYEQRDGTAAFVPSTMGERYYAGGFIGGPRAMFIVMCAAITLAIGDDAEAGIVATWHDESHVNRWLAENPPEVTLSPSYCHPEDASWYRSAIWPEEYEPKIVALDKPPEERIGRT